MARDSIVQRNASVAVIWHAANALDDLACADASALILAEQRRMGGRETRAADVENGLRWALTELTQARRALDRALPVPKREVKRGN